VLPAVLACNLGGVVAGVRRWEESVSPMAASNALPPPSSASVPSLSAPASSSTTSATPRSTSGWAVVSGSVTVSPAARSYSSPSVASTVPRSSSTRTVR